VGANGVILPPEGYMEGVRALCDKYGILLICDEVTSALDVLVREEILQLLLRLKREGEMGILFITHDLPLAARICDRIAVMERGTIVETGPADQVLTNPSAAETKRLIEAILTL